MRSRKGEFDSLIDSRYDEELDEWILGYSELEPLNKIDQKIFNSINNRYKKDLPWNDDYYPY